MVGLETALSLLQNKTRREILERLVREPHYPLQLATLIGVSQPAIVKHLKKLESGGLVNKAEVPSERGGPPRTIFSVEEAFSVQIDIGPDLFRCEQRTFPKISPIRLSPRLPSASRGVAESLSGRKKIAVAEGLAHLRTLSAVLDDLDAQRDAIISLHQHVRQRVSAGVASDFDVYEERSIIQTMVEANGEPLDLTSLIEHQLVGEQNPTEALERIRNQLERQIARRSGQVIAAPLNSELRWYLGPGPK